MKKTIGLILPNAMKYYWATVINSVEETASKHAYKTVLATTEDDSKKEINRIRSFLNQGVAGLILQPFDRKENIECYLELKRKKLPLIFINKILKDVKTDFIIPDIKKGTYKLITHLISIGHKRIGYIGDGRKRYSYFEHERLDGYKKAFQQHNIRLDEKLIFERKGSNRDIGYETMKAFLGMKQCPTAVFAFGDEVAIGALSAIKDIKKRVPEDIALAGYHDSSFAVSIKPHLTSVALPNQIMGRKAVEILMAKIEQGKEEKPRRITLEPKLIIRESSSTLSTPKKGKCLVCGKIFFPWQWNFRQMVCSHPLCQYTRRTENMRQWREKYGDYFSGNETDYAWQKYRSNEMKKWRQKHPDYFRHYRQVHREKYRKYILEYMREYRKKNM